MAPGLGLNVIARRRPRECDLSHGLEVRRRFRVRGVAGSIPDTPPQRSLWRPFQCKFHFSDPFSKKLTSGH